MRASVFSRNDKPMSEPNLQASPRRPGAWAFDAVVIGASSGGIELLGTLLPRFPAAFPAAVLVVQHLRGDSRSLLHELYAPRCALTLCEAADKQPIEPGTVYFAPPDYHLLVEFDHTCALSVDDPVRYSRPSIDVLFESAAWAYRARLLGILLTGANDDGSAGMAAIREAGGTNWAQLPSTARSPIMPRSAIERGVVDEVLTPDAIGSRLAASITGFAGNVGNVGITDSGHGKGSTRDGAGLPGHSQSKE
jgi:two-component system chemotaxis response regulator CheB